MSIFFAMALETFLFHTFATSNFYTFHRNDANIRFKEWNPADPHGSKLSSLAFWGADQYRIAG